MPPSGTKPKIDYHAVKIEFVHSNVTLAELADRYNVKLPTMRKYAERHGWQVERVAAEQKAVAAASEKAATQRVSDLIAFNSDDLKIARAIRAKVAKKIQDSGDGPIPMNELRILASAAEAAQRIGRLALGASTDNLGHAGQDGQGPIEHAEVTTEAYLAAREQVLKEY